MGGLIKLEDARIREEKNKGVAPRRQGLNKLGAHGQSTVTFHPLGEIRSKLRLGIVLIALRTYRDDQMSRRFKQGLLGAALAAILAIAVPACSPAAIRQSTSTPEPTDSPSPTSSVAPAPSNTPTVAPSPTASPTEPSYMECFTRYGQSPEAAIWGDSAEERHAEAVVTDPNSSAPSASEHPRERSISSIFTPEVQSWSAHIQRWSAIYQLDPNLVATVMQIESCGHPLLISPAGAIGLFQVMPFHFSPSEDPFNPEINAQNGLSILASGLELSGGRTDIALAIYNAGYGVIAKDSSEWSPETRHYVTWGSGILDDIDAGNELSTSLQLWLQAGGENLCFRACLALVSPHMIDPP